MRGTTNNASRTVGAIAARHGRALQIHWTRLLPEALPDGTHVYQGLICARSSPPQVGAAGRSTCQRRTRVKPLLMRCRERRAYIHHLLEAREMLASILLEHHNTHHMQRFMADVRKSIKDGTFQRLKSAQQSARLTAYEATT